MRNDYRTELESVDIGTQYSGKGASRHRGETSNARHPTATNRHYAITSGNVNQSCSEYEDGDFSVQFTPTGASVGNEELSGEYADGYRETGWEDERAIFTGTLTGEAETSQTHNEADAYLTNPVSYSHSLGTDSAFLFGNLTEIIDEDYEPEDCTAQPVIVDKKDKEKHYGPVMEGM